MSTGDSVIPFPELAGRQYWHNIGRLTFALQDYGDLFWEVWYAIMWNSKKKKFELWMCPTNFSDLSLWVTKGFIKQQDLQTIQIFIYHTIAANCRHVNNIPSRQLAGHNQECHMPMCKDPQILTGTDATDLAKQAGKYLKVDHSPTAKALKDAMKAVMRTRCTFVFAHH